MTAPNTRLKGVTEFGRTTISEQVEQNLVSFFDWGTLNIGGFVNVYIPATGLYGGQEHVLHPVTDPNYTQGKVWQAFRKNWVWESGVAWSPAPISVSGVFVNNVFRPASGVGNYAHTIDYVNGRVVFASGLPLNSAVKCEYSYKIINWTGGDDAIIRDSQFNSYQSEDGNFPVGSGNWAQLPQSRLQYPIVAMDVVERRKFIPMQLGGGQYVVQDVLCMAMAETEDMRDKIVDILSLQKDKTLIMYDINQVYASGRAPLRYDGSLNPSGIRDYPTLVSMPVDGGFAYKRMRIVDASIQQQLMYSPSLYGGIVRLSCEIEMPEI